MTTVKWIKCGSKLKQELQRSSINTTAKAIDTKMNIKYHISVKLIEKYNKSEK